MLRAALLAAAALALGAPATAHAADALFTVAGGGVAQPRTDLPAGLARFEDGAQIAALPDGQFLISSDEQVWRVDAQGVMHVVAGVDRTGYTGDGGPATLAEISVTGLAVLPGGGFLILDEENQRVRMVDPNGIISTVAGGGTSTADGIPATQAALDFPDTIAALPGGGFVIGDDSKIVREVGPDGRIRTILGGGDDERVHGQPGTALEIEETGLAAEPDGSVLVAEEYLGRIDRVAPDGTVRVALRPPKGTRIEPSAIATLPGGGFAFFDDRTGAHRIWRVSPAGAMQVVAGGGPFLAPPPAGLGQIPDGEPATSFDLPSTQGLAALSDGGLLYAYERTDTFDGVVGYVAPPAPGRLAVGVLRDRGRVFARGRRATLHVTLTRPATLTVTVAGHKLTRALPAGRSTVRLPRLPLARQAVTLEARDAAGGEAVERAHVYPVGWLPAETAKLVADSLLAHSFAESCNRRSPARVSCRMDVSPDRCRDVAVSYVHGRIRWSSAPCDDAFDHHPRVRTLRRSDWLCSETFCPPPAVFGRVGETALMPPG
jgi:hypothetical protein